MTLTPRSPRRQRSRATDAATARVHPLVVALALAGALPSLAMAQAAQPATLPGVTVTASGAADPLPEAYAGGQVARGGRLGIFGNQDMMDVPFSVTSYTAEAIQNQQAHTVADVLANDPGVRSTYGYGNFAESFVVRGYQLNGDDLSYNGLYGIAPRQLVAVEGTERVEVFRGANAFLGGVSPTGTGIGGGINLVPKFAPATSITQATVDYTSDAQVGGHVDVARRFGPDDRFGARVNALARGGDTSIDKENRDERLLTLGLDYRGRDLRLNADVGYQKETVREGRTMVQLTEAPLPAVPPASTNFAQPWAVSRLEDTYGTLRGEYDFLKGWTAYAAFGAHHSNEFGDYGGAQVDGKGVGTGYRLTVPFRQDTTSEEAGVRGNFATGPVRHTINLAWSGLQSQKRSAYEWSTNYDTNLYNAPVVPYPTTLLYQGGNMTDPLVTGRTNLISYAFSDTLSFFDDRVLATAGVRHQILSQRDYDYNTGALSAGGDYHESATTPVFGLVVKPLSGVSVYFNHMEGLSKGPASSNDASSMGKTFPPVRSKQNEAGVKWDGGKIGTSLAVYELQMPTGLNQNGMFTVNGQRNRGIELSAFGEPLRGVRLIAGAAFIDTKMSNTGSAATDGNKAVGVPAYTLNASVEWDLPWVPGMSVSGRLLQTGSQYADLANQVKLPSWTRIDLGARYGFKVASQRYTVRAAVENVANRAYWTSAYGGYLVEGRPRTFKVSMTADF